MTLLEYLRKVGVDLNGDFLSHGTRLFAELAIELEAQRKTYRNGHREGVWETQAWEIPLGSPGFGRGTTSPVCSSRGAGPNTLF